MDIIGGFDMWLRASGRRPTPRDRILRTVSHYLARCNGSPPFERQSFLTYLADSATSVKRITLRNRWDHLRVFASWAVSEGLAAVDPLAGIKRPQVGREEAERDVDPITRQQLDAMIAVCPQWTWLGQRDRAILLCLWDTPLRASELCGLLVTDVDWSALELRVRDGKGGCRYEAPFTDEAGLAISRYVRNRRYDSAILFVAQNGMGLTPHALGQLLRRLAARAGITSAVFPHRFRHTYRIRMKAMGMDDADSCALMGQRSITSTWGYGRRAVREGAKARLRERLAG